MRNERINRIFFDLDGTLINPRRRLYELFTEISGSNMGFEEYWKYKDEGRNQRQMLEFISCRCSYEEFHNRWMREIERKDLLVLDEVFDDVVSVLSAAREAKIKMYIVTNRQSYENLMWELEWLRIKDFFDRIITTFQQCSKDEAVLRTGLATSESLFVGDSKEDMEAARALGVIGGLLQRDNMYKDIVADIYIHNMTELRGVLL